MNSRIAKALIFSIVSLTPACLSDCTSPTSPEDVPCPPGIKPGIQVLYAFEDRYPNAEDVAWDMEGNYYVATFTLLSAPANAWFNESGEWLLSLTEYAFEQLSYSIPEALSNSNYADWKVQHVNLLERMSMGHIYVIKVTDCAKYVDLYYSRLGDLIRVQQTHAANYLHYPVIIPPKINRTIDSLFNKPEIIDMWKETLSINVALLDSTIYYFVAFTSDHDWICTFREVAKEQVPSNVMNSFSSSEFGVHPVDFVRLLQNDESFYLFYFTSEEGIRHVLYIKENGSLHGFVSY